MVNLFPTILYSCMAGMVVLALFDIVKQPKNSPRFYIKCLLALMLIHVTGELFIYSGAYVYAPGVAGFQFPFRVLLGPALYFYTRSVISPHRNTDKKRLGLALSGPLVVILVMIPFIFMISPAEKLALATPSTRDPELWKIAVFTCLSTTCVFIFYTAYFLLQTHMLHQSHRTQLMNRFAKIDTSSLDWIRPILLVWGLVWLAYAVEFSVKALGWTWFGAGTLLPLLEALALAMFIQKALSQRELMQEECSSSVLNTQQKNAPDRVRLRTSLLSAEKMQSISEKLKQAMSQDKLFLQDNLSLKHLAESIEETENHISETLSQYLHTNFYQFVNGHRIEAAKIALQDSDRQITSIAFDVGFNSKSTFNAAFKKIVKHSPSSYRNSMHKRD